MKVVAPVVPATPAQGAAPVAPPAEASNVQPGSTEAGAAPSAGVAPKTLEEAAAKVLAAKAAKDAPPATEVAKPAAETARQFAALSRKTTELHKSQATFKAEREKFETDKKDFEAKGLESVSLVKLANENPLGFLEKIGVDPKTFLLSIGRPAPKDDPLAKLTKQVESERTKREAIEKQLEADKKASADKDAAAQAELQTRQIAHQKTLITGIMAEKPEEFELLLAHEDSDEKGNPQNGADLVWDLRWTRYEEARAEEAKAVARGASQEELTAIAESANISNEEAAKMAEEFLVERAKSEMARLSRSKKLSGVAPVAPPPPVATEPAASRSAGRGIGRSPTLAGAPPPTTKPPAPSRPMTKAERDAELEVTRQAIIARHSRTR